MDFNYYGGQPMGFQPPYQRPQMQYSQMPQQAPAQQMQAGIVGRVVQSANDIMPGDMPMNGTPCFFPMQDGSAIYMKAWTRDGLISTMKFVPEQSAQKEPTQLDRIENMLKRYFEEQSVPPVRIEAGNE